MQKMLVIVVVFTITLGFVPAQSLAASPKIIISAVQITGGSGFTGNDFIELFNPSSMPVNLKDMRLVKRAANSTTDSSIKSWTVDTFIPPHSFYLWASSGYSTIAVTPDITTSSTISADNGVALRSGALDTGEIIDSLSWGITNNGFDNIGVANPGTNESISRTNLYGEKTFQILASNPRNSSIQFFPSTQPEPVLINNSSCEIEQHQIETNINTDLYIDLKFVNTGTSTWSNEYSIVDSANTKKLLTGQVLPGESIITNIALPVFSNLGSYSLTWQMQDNLDNLFGQPCTVNVVVQEPEIPILDTALPKVIITEVMPNPQGEDAGYEKVELYNFGDIDIDLTGLVLDDVVATDQNQVELTANAYTLPLLVLPAKAFIALTIPADRFDLNNAEGDSLVLATSTGLVVSSINYSEAPEGKSYSLIQNSWTWQMPTFGTENVINNSEEETSTLQEEQGNNNAEAVPDLTKLEISEVYASPTVGDLEFLELYNSGNVEFKNLDLIVKIGDNQIPIKIVNLLPGKYFVITKPSLSIPLPNAGKLVQIFSANLQKVAEINYPKTTKGQSFAKIENFYKITQSPTPGLVNVLTEPSKSKSSHSLLSSSTAKQTPKTTKFTEKSSQVKVNKKTGNASINTNSKLKKTVNAKMDSKSQSNIISNVDNKDEAEAFVGKSINEESKKDSKNPWEAIAIGFSVVMAGGFAVYKYGLSGLPL